MVSYHVGCYEIPALLILNDERIHCKNSADLRSLLVGVGSLVHALGVLREDSRPAEWGILESCDKNLESKRSFEKES